jgi:hypothetical protein
MQEYLETLDKEQLILIVKEQNRQLVEGDKKRNLVVSICDMALNKARKIQTQKKSTLLSSIVGTLEKIKEVLK